MKLGDCGEYVQQCSQHEAKNETIGKFVVITVFCFISNERLVVVVKLVFIVAVGQYHNQSGNSAIPGVRWKKK